MDGGPSLTFVLLALLSGFCAGGWLCWRLLSGLARKLKDDAERGPGRLRRARAAAAAAGLGLLGASLLLPVQSLVLTAAFAGFGFVALFLPRSPPR